MFHFTDESNQALTPRDVNRFFARDGISNSFGISSDSDNSGQIFYSSINEPSSSLSGLTLIRVVDFDTLEELNPGVPIAPGQFGCGGMIWHRSGDRKTYINNSSNGLGQFGIGSGNPWDFGVDYTPLALGGMIDIDPASSSGPSNTTTHTTVTGTVFNMSPNYFATNKAFEAKFWGRYNAGIGQTLRYRVFLGTQALFDQTITCVNNAVNRQWELELTGVCIAGGATGTFRTYGRFYDNNTDAVSPVLTSGAIDLTAAQDFALTQQWGAADVLNSTITQLHYYKGIN